MPDASKRSPFVEKKIKSDRIPHPPKNRYASGTLRDRILHPPKKQSHSSSLKIAIAYGTLRDRITHPPKKALAANFKDAIIA